MKTIHSPGVVPTFALGFNRGIADGPPGGDTWVGIPGAVGFPNRFTLIDEVVPNDADYISQGLGRAASIYIEDLGPPILGAGAITYSFRLRTMGGNNTASQVSSTSLFRGGTLIHTETIPYPLIGTAFVTFAVPLSGAEITALYGAAGNIRMFFGGGGFAGPPDDAEECSWSEVAYYS